ncbi:ABC transporter ATP-binding protein [Candidatus Palauibacter sp.]|uniref:ABC transporter ATP-binding protein n=1 Tax=Candidatus Palauibacter sp. TaxID=3101350 RepID=UPI003AF1FDA7
MIGNVDTPAIRLQGVTKRFGKKTAVRNLDLEVPRGSICGLIGPNGAGKTTTLRMILDIIGADTGSVEMFGSSDIEAARARVGYLPEERGLYQKMTAVDHLAFFGQLKGIRRKEALTLARAGLEAVGLGDRADDKVETLSKGMAQKTQFLGVILHEPELLVLDEPFSGLDPLNVDLFKEMMLERQRAGATILLSTHLIEDAERLCERVCMIAGATKVLDGRLRDIRAAAGRRDVAISFEGNPEFLDAPDLIERVAAHGRYVEVRMLEGADPQALLRRAVDSGARISRFELIEPSLREIFIEKATEAGLSHEDVSEDDEAAA